MIYIAPKKGSNLLRRFQRFFSRPDFKRNPCLATWKRLWWRIRWRLTNDDWILRLPNGLRISVPKSGAGALIYYQGWSEPEVAAFLYRFLRPGMTFIDVGAHIGEYVLLAKSLIGEDGSVHAFEPDPRNYQFLQYNVRLNSLQQVFLQNCVVSNQTGKVTFALFKEPSISRITVQGSDLQNESLVQTVDVPATSLDEYVQKHDIAKIDLVKIDVEGAELQVLEGASNLFSSSQDGPVILFEYSPENCRRFGYDAGRIIALLKVYGYQVYMLQGQGKISEMATNIQNLTFGTHLNLIAFKNERKLSRE